MTRSRLVAIVLLMSTVTAFASCSSATSKRSDGTDNASPTSVAATSTGNGTKSAPGSHKNVKMPTSGCLLTDQQASELAGSALKGTSVSMGQGGVMCTYRGDGSAGISISVKPYSNASQAKQLVNAVLAAKGVYPDAATLDVGDGGVAGCVKSLCLARFTTGDIFVEITLRPGSHGNAVKAANMAAATF